MAMTAYVLVDTKAGKDRDVKEALQATEYVERVNRIQGPHDVVAKVVAPDLWELDEVVSIHIRGTEGVTRTTTCLGVTIDIRGTE